MEAKSLHHVTARKKKTHTLLCHQIKLHKYYFYKLHKKMQNLNH